ncbi:hypothetical protein CDAR_14411 [Caerostris darwini]|uniref:Uncharacterized protein n=1 Tax=Caerostris darwini TaxID=1538125 RepID=A0AAV4QBE2_9ARAC|nr:hypothetical protein CDAR_14411 [Caerostris darwini]
MTHLILDPSLFLLRNGQYQSRQNYHTEPLVCMLVQMEWPPFALNLNSFGHVWRALRRLVVGLKPLAHDLELLYGINGHGYPCLSLTKS